MPWCFIQEPYFRPRSNSEGPESSHWPTQSRRATCVQAVRQVPKCQVLPETPLVHILSRELRNCDEAEFITIRIVRWHSRSISPCFNCKQLCHAVPSVLVENVLTKQLLLECCWAWHRCNAADWPDRLGQDVLGTRLYFASLGCQTCALAATIQDLHDEELYILNLIIIWHVPSCTVAYVFRCDIELGAQVLWALEKSLATTVPRTELTCANQSCISAIHAVACPFRCHYCFV